MYRVGVIHDPRRQSMSVHIGGGLKHLPSWPPPTRVLSVASVLIPQSKSQTRCNKWTEEDSVVSRLARSEV